MSAHYTENQDSDGILDLSFKLEQAEFHVYSFIMRQSSS